VTSDLCLSGYDGRHDFCTIVHCSNTQHLPRSCTRFVGFTFHLTVVPATTATTQRGHGGRAICGSQETP
jgi:hypothetical protein